MTAQRMPKKPRRSPDLPPDSPPPDRRDEEAPGDRRGDASETPDSLPPPEETIPGARTGAANGRFGLTDRAR